MLCWEETDPKLTQFKSQNLLISNTCLKKNYYVLEASLVAMEMDLTKSIVLHISNFQLKQSNLQWVLNIFSAKHLVT